MTEGEVRMGAVGCGAFGQFALGHFARGPTVRIAAVADVRQEVAGKVARRFEAKAYTDIEALVASPKIDLVYLATPPWLHHEHAMAALRAGKHVICEKPLALDLSQADRMLRAARERDRLMVTDLMQRYNPLFEAVQSVVRERLLGEPLHGYFENYAKDEPLPPDHWFWDRARSGGIFVEHGVHFFDIWRAWLGQGRVIAAQRTLRPETSIEEQVQCTVRYRETVLVNFYHGFHQPERLDRQRMCLVFERGDLVLHGWVPTAVTVHAVADHAAVGRLRELFPGAEAETLETYRGDERKCMGRHKQLEIDQQIVLRAGSERGKDALYGQLLRAFLADQAAGILDPDHARTVTEQDGRTALARALEADRLAHAG